MKIGVAALGRLSEDTGGKNYIVHFFRELERTHAGHHFVLFLSHGEAGTLNLPETKHLRIVEIPNSKRTPLHKVFGEQLLLPRYIRGSGVAIMYFPGNFISLASRVPAIVNIRATAHFYGAKYGVSRMRRIVRSLLMPPSAHLARRIIAPSDNIAEDIVRFTHVERGKIEVIPHGVDLTLFDGETNKHAAEGLRVIEKYGLSPQAYILYVSALWRYKNHDKLIRAHADLLHRGIDTKLVIAGQGTGLDSKYIHQIQTLPKELGSVGKVVFTGGVSQSDLRYLYAHASAFVFPSSYESFGNPIFEAWASGIPVATSNVHSFPEIVSDAGLLFDPRDVRSIGDAIESLLMDQNLRSTLIARGQERAKNFTWERCVKRTLSLIESVSPTMEAP